MYPQYRDSAPIRSTDRLPLPCQVFLTRFLEGNHFQNVVCFFSGVLGSLRRLANLLRRPAMKNAFKLANNAGVQWGSITFTKHYALLFVSNSKKNRNSTLLEQNLLESTL